MSRAPNRIRQAEIERALRAATRCGLSVSRIEVDPATGKISVHTGGAPELTKEAAAAAAYDEWKRERDNARKKAAEISAASGEEAGQVRHRARRR